MRRRIRSIDPGVGAPRSAPVDVDRATLQRIGSLGYVGGRTQSRRRLARRSRSEGSHCHLQRADEASGAACSVAALMVPLRRRLRPRWSLLRTAPAMGRLFGPEHDRPGKETEVVVTDGFWRRVLGTDPNVLGKKVRLSDVACTIIGVFGPRFVSSGMRSGTEPEVRRPLSCRSRQPRRAMRSSCVGASFTFSPAVVIPSPAPPRLRLVRGR